MLFQIFTHFSPEYMRNDCSSDTKFAIHSCIGKKDKTSLCPHMGDSVKTTSLLADVASILCIRLWSHRRRPWEKKKGCRRRGASAGAARWRRCRSSSPLVLLSFLGSARPELAVCWVRSLPDTRLRDLTFTERKSRE